MTGTLKPGMPTYPLALPGVTIYVAELQLSLR